MAWRTADMTERFGDYTFAGVMTVLAIMASPIFILMIPFAIIGWAVIELVGWWGKRG